eukprot:TRINITY_DN2892_c0_g1_i3.p1 TRINITY_DN2892_c0_g1~~TRINITY_DN2892_c0_g1_i3.p1  ORF type:complete len:151 (-),score=17.02 TRINITY_DN2892_c0_g1_i3:118-570(-)
MMFMDDTRKIGVGLTAFGSLFLTLGVLFFFDKGLLALGNILFLAGVALVIGVKNTTLFFLKRRNGALCFLGGILIVLLGWPIIGMLIEIFGIFNLFGNFFPYVLAFLARTPCYTVLAPCLNPCFAFLSKLKVVQQFINRTLGQMLPTYSE